MIKKETTTKTKPIISMRGIYKAFPLVQANDNIDLDIYPYEIQALLGENGAGKSTLMKILYGFYRADSGSIIYRGRPISIRSPRDAMNIHIGMVFQDLAIIPALSVTENIALFLQDLPFVYSIEDIRKRIQKISQRYRLDINPDAKASQLSIGQLQKVEIIKLLISDAKLLILDEPTRVLAPHEVDALFNILKNLREDGYAIILITHKLHEVMDSANRVTVLRKGRVSGTLLRSQLSEKKLIQLMFSKSLFSPENVSKRPSPSGSPVLQLREVDTKGEISSVSLKKINLEILPGEIVGVAGVSGNGQKELGDVVLGMEQCARGDKYLFGKNANNWSIRDVRKSGVAFIPENPLHMAIAGWLPVLENIAITRMWLYSISGGLRINWKKVTDDAKRAFTRLGFEIPHLFTPANSLSGGNLQRMTIARELLLNSKLIIASYLTRGLDVQSTLAAHQALRDARDSGSGVLLISEDLEELFLLSDRLIVVFEGKIVGQFTPEETNIFEVGHLMTGSKVSIYESTISNSANSK